MKPGKALFDFDGTLVGFDSFVKFAWRFVPGPRLLKGLLLGSPRLLGWKLGLNSSSVAKERLFSLWFKGLDVKDFDRYCTLMADELDKGVRKDMIEELERHQAAGRETLIVSASIAGWIRPWAERHRISKVIATEPEVTPDGKLTGRFATPNCLGSEKVRRLFEAYPDLGDYETWAYTDSPSDRPLLAVSDHPHLL